MRVFRTPKQIQVDRWAPRGFTPHIHRIGRGLREKKVSSAYLCRVAGGGGETATLALIQKIRMRLPIDLFPCTENPWMAFFQDLPLRRQVMKRLVVVYMS